MSTEVPIIILLILIPTFFFIRWILKKRITDSSKRNISSFLLSLIISPILYLVFIFLFFSYLFHEPQKDFNQDKWFANKLSRYEMRDDIVNSNILKNKTKQELIQLIGKPDIKDSTNIWIYDLGTSGAGLGWQFNSLKITFKNREVSDVKKIELRH